MVVPICRQLTEVLSPLNGHACVIVQYVKIKTAKKHKHQNMLTEDKE